MLQNQETIKAALERANESEKEIGKILSCDVVCYIGQLEDVQHFSLFRDSIEAIADKEKSETLAICLTTGGGVAEIVEGMVGLIRHHYRRVYFVVPAYAMSAGTIFCMSGDEIYMDYSSCLGPIDPQIFVDGEGYVPAQGYLDKVEELVEKSRDNTITLVEFTKVKEMDLATLRAYEQARALSIELLKKWLVEYKFKDWETHESDPKKLGKKVTMDEKRTRAKEIGKKLSDNNIWLSHGRRIHMDMMRDEVRLKIKDFGETPELSKNIRLYYNILLDYYRYRVALNVTPNSSPILIYSSKLGGTLS